jgi:tetratricopeptide (TPR) repeat protein
VRAGSRTHRFRPSLLLPVVLLLPATAGWYALRAQRRAAAERHYQAGMAALRSGDDASAIGEIAAAGKDAPDDGGFHFRLADACEQLQQRDQAAEHLERALRLSAPREAEYARLLSAYWALGRFSDAERVLRRDVLTRWPKSAEAAYYEGLLRFYGSKGPESLRHAAAAFERCLQANPDHLEARYHYAACLSGLGEVAKAEQAYRQLVRANPVHNAALYGLARALVQQGKRSQARRALDEFRRIDGMQRRVTYLTTQTAVRPEAAEAYLELGTLYLALRRPDKAAEALVQYGRRRPDDTRGLRKLAEACRRLRLPGDAAVLERQARSLDARKAARP